VAWLVRARGFYRDRRQQRLSGARLTDQNFAMDEKHLGMILVPRITACLFGVFVLPALMADALSLLQTLISP
jgi:hypothetical protein